MAQSLPTTAAEQQIWHFCQRLEFFAHHLPLALNRLAASSTNDNFYVRTQRGHYLMRLYSPEVTGRCRHQELRCQHAAAAAGVAPAPLCLNNHQRVLISEFITHSHHFGWDEHSYLHLSLLKQLVKLHQLKVQTPPLEVRQYLSQLHAMSAQLEWQATDEQCWQALCQAAEDFMQYPSDLVLAHLDLHSANILIRDQQLWLIDYEYCQQADSCFDLAGLAVNFELNAAQEAWLLRSYTESRAQPLIGLAEKLPLAKIIYGGFCWLWYRALSAKSQRTEYSKSRLCSLLIRE